MKQIRKFFGLLCMLMGPLSIYYLMTTAIDEINHKPVIDTKIQWIVFVIVFIPIALGLILFGYYAMKGEYERLPESSAEIAD
jgi:predicted Na+-dependent transporter